MKFEAYKISENNYQIFMLTNHNQKEWLASFNGLNTLIIYYIHCHNLSMDEISFKGTRLTEEEKGVLESEMREWSINVSNESFGVEGG